MLFIMAKKLQKPAKNARPPRIRVPNNERALFTVEGQKFVGVVKRVSLTGGSAVLANGFIPNGTLAEMGLSTVFGKVQAQIQFLQPGADGIPLAQAFRFLDMDETSRERFSAAAEQMKNAGFSDVNSERKPLDLAYQSLSKWGESIHRLSVEITSSRRTRSKK
jgi:hypothetical protein